MDLHDLELLVRDVQDLVDLIKPEPERRASINAVTDVIERLDADEARARLLTAVVMLEAHRGHEER